MTDMQLTKDEKRRLTNKKYYENKKKTNKSSVIDSDTESTNSYNNTERKYQPIPSLPPTQQQSSYIDNFIITNLLNEINSLKCNYQFLQNELNNNKNELVNFKSQNQILQNELNNIKLQFQILQTDNNIK